MEDACNQHQVVKLGFNGLTSRCVWNAYDYKVMMVVLFDLGCVDFSIIVGSYLMVLWISFWWWIYYRIIMFGLRYWLRRSYSGKWNHLSCHPFLQFSIIYIPNFQNFLMVKFITLSKPVIHSAVQLSRNCWKSSEIFRDNTPFNSRQPVPQLEITHRRNCRSDSLLVSLAWPQIAMTLLSKRLVSTPKCWWRECLLGWPTDCH